MIEVTKSIFIKGLYDLEYCIQKADSNNINVYSRDSWEPYSMDLPLMVLSIEEARAISRALGELADGY